MVVARLLHDEVVIDRDPAGLYVDIGDEEVWIVIWKRIGPEELSGVAVERPDSSAFSDIDGNVVLLAFLDRGTDPLHVFRIRVNGCPEENSFVRVVLIPIVARQVLVIPFQLSC